MGAALRCLPDTWGAQRPALDAWPGGSLPTAGAEPPGVGHTPAWPGLHSPAEYKSWEFEDAHLTAEGWAQVRAWWPQGRRSFGSAACLWAQGLG